MMTFMEKMKISIPIFIPSYHRPSNLKTVYYLINIGFPKDMIYVFIDDETDDIEEYRKNSKLLGFNLVIFNMKEARDRYDYVHRASISRRSAGQARNMFQDYAKEHGIDTYFVHDDDTVTYRLNIKGYHIKEKYIKNKNEGFFKFYNNIGEFVKKHKIGLFGFSQSGDWYNHNKLGEKPIKMTLALLKNKVMNSTYYNVKYIYRGERGVQDDDTAMFTGVLNQGLFTGTIYNGFCLQQSLSATQKGGLTDLYEECKLLNKSLVSVIMYPSAIKATVQKANGNRIHHKIDYRYLKPCLLKGKRSNIAWDTYPEDYPFTNEPKRTYKLNR